MAKELIINASLPETRIALQEDGKIQEILIERASDRGIVGNIYKGRVTRVLPGMQAAFVDIGLEKAAFLYVDDVYNHAAAMKTRGVTPVTREEREEEEEASAAPMEDMMNEEFSESSSDQDQALMDENGPDEATDEISEEGEETAEESGDESPESDDDKPVEMAAAPGEGDEDQASEGAVEAPSSANESSEEGDEGEGAEEAEGESAEASESSEGGAAPADGDRTRRRRRGRRGGKRRRGREGERSFGPASAGAGSAGNAGNDRPAAEAGSNPGSAYKIPGEEGYPDPYYATLAEKGDLESDRAALAQVETGPRGTGTGTPARAPRVDAEGNPIKKRGEFRDNRARDRQIRSSHSGSRGYREQANIADLLKEGQEVIVQVAKDPIAAKGARLTCHVSLAGRHLVCMPTVDHVGVSRRIERDDERRRLRQLVDSHRPQGMGFIVRTASGGKEPDRLIKQDIDYLVGLWSDIQKKSQGLSAPALVYEDLNPVLRSIRDWVNEDIDKIIVDSRFYYNEIKQFAGRVMPSLEPKVELYHGDIPIFDAYGIATELHRSLERKVWLKSGGYIVIDQAEALVAIDVNTGRYVGKKNLEDTILKTNLEAVEEIAYQLRVRNCGGIIILDLIDMEREENRHRVYRALEDALKKDRARPTIMKISDLGLIEMTRKRTRDTMVRTLCETCTHCEGRGFVKSKQTVAYEVLREMERHGVDREVKKILVQAHPDVIDILAIDMREVLDQLERRYRKDIYLQAIIDYHNEQFEVIGDRSGKAQPATGYGRVHRDRDRDRERGRDRDRGDRESKGDRDRNNDRGDRGDRESRGPRREGRGDHRDMRRGRENPERQNRGDGQEQADQQAQPVQPRNEIRISSNRPEANTDIEPGQNFDYAAHAGLEVPRSVGNIAPTDPDSIGNQVGSQRPPMRDDFENEEDRLAYLRAQAAQDAALAGFGDPAKRAMNQQNRGGGGGGGGGHGGGRGGRGPNNNGRGGRRGNRGGRDRGPRRHGGFRPGGSAHGSQQYGGGGYGGNGNGSGDGGNE